MRHALSPADTLRHDGGLPAGASRIDVEASALPAGVCVVRVLARTFSEARMLTVVR